MHSLMSTLGIPEPRTKTPSEHAHTVERLLHRLRCMTAENERLKALIAELEAK